MLTPQEVASHAFPKAVVGGYNMSSVDEFLDELTDDYTTLYKENAALKAKMKVLVEKVEDYRATEDSMRATLLTAQKMADSIVKEAEAKRDQLMAQAEADAREKLGRLQAEHAEIQERLKAGQKELAEFIAASREICAKEMAYLDQLPQLPVETAPAAPTPEELEQQEKAAVGEIEQNVFAAFHEEELKAAQASEEEPAQEEPDYPEGDPFAGEEPVVDEPTRRIDLKDLKFGRNYSGEGD